MRFSSLLIMTFMILGILSPGCASSKKVVLPVHDDVLIYPLPYDLTYLRTMDALQDIPNWELEETEKEHGIIKVRNINYGAWNDADKRLIIVRVKSLAANQTSVQLAPESQSVIGGDELLKQVSSYLKKEI